jgi:hypothetical protein
MLLIHLFLRNVAIPFKLSCEAPNPKKTLVQSNTNIQRQKPCSFLSPRNPRQAVINTAEKHIPKGRRRISKPTRDHRSGSKQLAYKVEEGMFQNLERKQAMQKISSQVPKTDKQTAKYP